MSKNKKNYFVLLQIEGHHNVKKYDSNEVFFTIIYRESQLSRIEKKMLISVQNFSTYVHAKICGILPLPVRHLPYIHAY